MTTVITSNTTLTVYNAHQIISNTEALPTANFKNALNSGRELFNTIRRYSPEFPLMVMEFWTGWFDFWSFDHQRTSVEGKETFT